MIQELLGGSALIAAETKISSINGPSSASAGVVLCPTTTTTTTTTPSSSSSTTATNSDNNQNLRCPRCDSSNTKFCYYNNYNLTQPRHFCKTCRRYWTKGGALRNIPIGGGCRKNRNLGTVSNSVVPKNAIGKVRTTVAAAPSSSVGGFMDHLDFPSSASPILWGSPQNSPILALLRNPNPNPSAMSVKEEGSVVGVGPHTMMNEAAMVGNGGGALGFEFDCVGQFPTTLGLCSSSTSIWRNNINNNTEDGIFLGQNHQSSTPNTTNGIQELYQRLRSSSSVNYCGDINNNSQVLMGSMPSSNSSSLSNMLDSASVVGAGDDQLGYTWNPTLSWGTSFPN